MTMNPSLDLQDTRGLADTPSSDVMVYDFGAATATGLGMMEGRSQVKSLHSTAARWSKRCGVASQLGDNKDTTLLGPTKLPAHLYYKGSISTRRHILMTDSVAMKFRQPRQIFFELGGRIEYWVWGIVGCPFDQNAVKKVDGSRHTAITSKRNAACSHRCSSSTSRMVIFVILDHENSRLHRTRSRRSLCIIPFVAKQFSSINLGPEKNGPTGPAISAFEAVGSNEQARAGSPTIEGGATC
ncbi:hypothetical protein FB451DRAFT_1192306 [Mycena latifolia]|nr:hypothetical protein FB451DRAFT_1192306 [Mycena latifolia]